MAPPGGSLWEGQRRGGVSPGGGRAEGTGAEVAVRTGAAVGGAVHTRSFHQRRGFAGGQLSSVYSSAALRVPASALQAQRFSLKANGADQMRGGKQTLSGEQGAD